MLQYHPAYLESAVKDVATMVAMLQSIYNNSNDMYNKIDLTDYFLNNRKALTEYFSGQTKSKTFENLCAAIAGLKELEMLKNLCIDVTTAMNVVEKNSALYHANLKLSSVEVERSKFIKYEQMIYHMAYPQFVKHQQKMSEIRTSYSSFLTTLKGEDLSNIIARCNETALNETVQSMKVNKKAGLIDFLLASNTMAKLLFDSFKLVETTTACGIMNNKSLSVEDLL